MSRSIYTWRITENANWKRDNIRLLHLNVYWHIILTVLIEQSLEYNSNKTLTSSIGGVEIARTIPFSKIQISLSTAHVWLERRPRKNVYGGGLRASNAEGVWLTSNATSISRAVFVSFVSLCLCLSLS